MTRVYLFVGRVVPHGLFEVTSRAEFRLRSRNCIFVADVVQHDLLEVTLRPEFRFCFQHWMDGLLLVGVEFLYTALLFTNQVMRDKLWMYNDYNVCRLST